jgi:hypothetical protein
LFVCYLFARSLLRSLLQFRLEPTPTPKTQLAERAICLRKLRVKFSRPYHRVLLYTCEDFWRAGREENSFVLIARFSDAFDGVER